jgi:undecaprenyl diphosphate synthase
MHNIIRFFLSENLLKHVAIIPDGNNRWARNHGKLIGVYAEGVEALEKIVMRANELKIDYVTAYLMSLENFQRRGASWLKAFFCFMDETIKSYIENKDFENVKIKAIGNLQILPGSLINGIRKIEEITKNNTGVTLLLAVAYSGRDEIIRAVNRFLCSSENREGCAEVTEKIFEKYLDTAGIPEPDLLIRTSGEFRLSGFLPWQLTYTEFFFAQELWPDFSVERFDEAVSEFYKRKRNFGMERT